MGTLHWEVYRSVGSAQVAGLEGEMERGLTQVDFYLPLFGSGVVVVAAAFFHWHFCCYFCPPSSVQWLVEELGLQQA